MPPNTSNFNDATPQLNKINHDATPQLRKIDLKTALAKKVGKELLEDDYQKDDDYKTLDDNSNITDQRHPNVTDQCHSNVKEQYDEHYDGNFDHPELMFSFRQMWIDTLNLDWSLVLWDMVFGMIVFHIFSAMGLYYALTLQPTLLTWIFSFATSYAGGLGITMGSHRLWTHRGYKAVLPVRVVLMLMNSLAFQESIYIWSQNHRLHHKWSDTDRDITNTRRGFFFAHIGWKMYATHPEVIKARKMIDVSDLYDDPVVYYQHHYYYYISLVVSFVLPTVIPMWLWGEGFMISFCCAACLRLAASLHATWCINSVAHLHGYKPYDRTLQAYECTFLGPFTLGEGWHNFHHAFPRDYRSSEMDGWGINFTTKLIDLLARLGLVYDRVQVDEKHLAQRTARTGSPELRAAAKNGTLYKLDKRKYTNY